jgi:glycosyltransferase involved in cell wall biosynthesis
LARSLLRRLDKVVAVTGNVRQSIEEVGVPPEQIECIPMCVDTRRFQPKEHCGPLRYFSQNGGSLRVLYVGNTSREKGLIQLLHAVKLLIDERLRISLVAAIENQSRIKEYATGYDQVHKRIGELQIGGCVHLVGVVDRIEDLYAESDFVVIPWETSRGPSDYPMVAMEAMAMGKCVISTPVGGCPELLDHGTAGILTDGFSAASLASAIRSAASNVEVRRAVERAGVLRAAELSLNAAARKTISLYERMVGAKDRRG